MPNLFVDIETVPDMTRDEYFEARQDVESGRLTRHSEDKDRFWKFERGGLTPFEGKVILITYNVNNAHTHRLKEWEDGEATILAKFFDLVADLQRGSSDDRLKIIGHNIFGFDLFFLYARMNHYKLNKEKWLYQILINKPQVVDFLQIHLPVNGFNTKGLKHDVLAHAYGFPQKETLGSAEILHYFQEDYDKITQYSEREFIYPQLYTKIESDGLVTASRLQESISWYDAKNMKNTG